MIQKAFIQSAQILAQLKEKGLLDDYAIIGAFALARVAIPRATGDIDYVIRRNEASLEQISQEISGESRTGESDNLLMGSITFNVPIDKQSWPVQLIEFPKSWQEIAFAQVETQQVGNIQQRFVSAKSLFLLKLYAGSPLDLEDARHIIRVTDFSTEEMQDIALAARRLRVSNRLKKVTR